MVKKRGPKPYEPTPGDRHTVTEMARAGVPWTDIAGVLRMSRTTLWRHFAVELRGGLVMARTHFTTTAYRRLDGVDKDGNPVDGMGLLADDPGAIALFAKLCDRLWLAQPKDTEQDFSEQDAAHEDSDSDRIAERRAMLLQRSLADFRRAGLDDLADNVQATLLERRQGKSGGSDEQRDEGAEGTRRDP